MGLTLHSIARQFSIELNATINDSVTEAVFIDAGKTPPAPPFWLRIDSEVIEVTGISADDPSAGIDTYTIARGAWGTTPASHTAGAFAKQLIDVYEFTELQAFAGFLNQLFVDMCGGGEGVQATSAGTNLKVVAQGTPDMTVSVGAGTGIVDGAVIALTEDEDTDTMTAPAANPRIDVVQVSSRGAVSVVTGTEAGSPSAPSVDSDALKLAEIYHRVGSTSIEDADDSTNSYITDARVFV